MNIRDQNTPPPPLENLQKLQLMRTTLVNFVEWRNFDEVVQGCYVRVLLEMRGDSDNRGRDSLDNYYITCVKGARKGPAYTGFSCDGVSTEWHILIELPPCFRSTPNGNVVQLNSISNSIFKRNEYDQWVAMTREAGIGFISAAQIDLRLSLLDEHRQQASIPGVTRRRRHNEDPGVTAAREAQIGIMKRELETEIKETHATLPHLDRLGALSIEQLQEVEQSCLDYISSVRLAINDKTKCRKCRKHVCTVIFYPCKHQVVCRYCSESCERCPAPDCDATVQAKFEAFAS